MDVQRIHQKLNTSPIILFLLGALSLLFWLAGTLIQVQTSELLALGETRPLAVANVSWGVLWQPVLLISGAAPVELALAWLYGWTVELVTLVFSLTLSVAVTKISATNPHLGKGFVVGSLLLIALNGWADYASAPAPNPMMKFLIALAISLIVVVGLPLGIGLIEKGLEEAK